MNATAKPPPKVFHASNCIFVPRFEHGHQAQIAEVCGMFSGSQLGAGFVKLTNASIPWTTRYDEVIVVLKGEISIGLETGRLHAKAGDSIWLPEGTALRYEADNALVFYAIHPADWTGTGAAT